MRDHVGFSFCVLSGVIDTKIWLISYELKVGMPSLSVPYQLSDIVIHIGIGGY